ncbi:MAG TPA: DUF1330 domain-containing protein [Thermoplasmata archaeon]|nr:DUF1330 domain-containing protein [Thermoplasmata archaeon]
MPAYLVADVEWHDAAALAKYGDGHSELLAKYGGKILVGSEAVDVIEGDWKPRILVIFEFPSKKDFRDWYDSTEYAPRLALRRAHADSNVVVVGEA